MHADLKFIEADGQLYRGFGLCWPAIVWLPQESRWSRCDLPLPQGDGWGVYVSEGEAARCYPGSTSTPLPEGVEASADLSGDDMIRYRPEVFDFYDFDISERRSPEEQAESRRQRDKFFSPPYMRERSAEVQIARWFGLRSLPRWARWRWFLRAFWLVQRPYMWRRG